MIRFTSTSFLLSSVHSWNVLKSKYSVIFGEYGDWHSVLFQPGTDKLVWVIFLRDIFSEEVIGEDDEKIDNQLQQIFSPLSNYLERSEEACIIVWSAYKPDSLIRNAKYPAVWKRLASKFEAGLYDLAREKKNLYILDLDARFAQTGLENAFSLRNYYASRCWLSSTGIRILAESVDNLLNRIKMPPKKMLVLDCDNTLWGGVIGEVGIQGIVLGTDGTGKAFSDFQKVIAGLARKGLLLSIASKNNEQEVWDVFDNSGEMILKRNMIVASRIDWAEKAINIRSIAEDLDLGLDSFVFWDDNPIEREKVLLALPEVTTIQVPDDVYKWPGLLAELDVFANFTTTSEDLKKNDQYHKRAAFVSEKKTNGDVKAFLKSISMKPSLYVVDENSLARAEQLCLKTNQFNLRTIRHNAGDIKKKSDREEAFITQLTDQYGDHGKIALAITGQVSEKIAFLDTFLMSCRVLGRYLESWVLSQVIEKLRSKGYRYLLAEFIPSGKNKVAEKFLSDNNFTICTDLDLVDAFKKSTYSNTDGTEPGMLYLAELDSINIPNTDIFNN